jgi:hypothetical protein
MGRNMANTPTVLLQAMKQEPAPGTKCRDKFLVQSAPITGDKEFVSIANIVRPKDLPTETSRNRPLTLASSQLDSTDKSTIQERKIRVTWITDSQPSAPVAATPSRHSAVTDLTVHFPL